MNIFEVILVSLCTIILGWSAIIFAQNDQLKHDLQYLANRPETTVYTDKVTGHKSLIWLVDSSVIVTEWEE
jgi:hypothetical protein